MSYCSWHETSSPSLGKAPFLRWKLHFTTWLSHSCNMVSNWIPILSVVPACKRGKQLFRTARSYGKPVLKPETHLGSLTLSPKPAYAGWPCNDRSRVLTESLDRNPVIPPPPPRPFGSASSETTSDFLACPQPRSDHCWPENTLPTPKRSYTPIFRRQDTYSSWMGENTRKVHRESQGLDVAANILQSSFWAATPSFACPAMYIHQLPI